MPEQSPRNPALALNRTPLAIPLLLAAMLAWLWPIGLGGCMPVGGDVTQFFLGLMAVLTDSLHAGKLPIWTNLWGYGFPGLAESQMGVLYPPHLLLYGTLSVEKAYVASMMLHTLWGALGAFWLARQFGISPSGAGLTAFSWSTCGFFMIHLAHPWGYTTGSWMPWALGLAWISLSSPNTRSANRSLPRVPWRAPLWLSLVLALQILPGHFQLAFTTHAAIGLMVVYVVVEGSFSRPPDGNPVPPGISLRAVIVLFAAAAAFPLAAAQLVPTARLAKLAANQRDFEYLSGFATSPFHLINFVAPGLFHRSPLWRDVVWDPFHTSPEEQLTYVGLIPLFLAICAIKSGFRRDRTVRLLLALAAVTLLLSLGPYFPGFRHVILLPGFSYFRASARWILVSTLALALLAGKGLDGWQATRQSARGIALFLLFVILWIGLTLGTLELAVACTSDANSSRVASWFDSGFKAMPWYGDKSFDPPDPSFVAVLANARRPWIDPRIPPVFAQKNQKNQSFVADRFTLYTTELREPVILMLALGALAWFTHRGSLDTDRCRAALLVLTLADLWVLGRHRLIDVGPLVPLTEQSTVLKRLTQEPHGTRSADSLRNLPMIAGVAPVSAYRTLTLPAVESLTAMAMPNLSKGHLEALVNGAIRATGVGLRVFNPVESRLERLLHRGSEPRETIEDPVLASWLYGADWTSQRGDWIKTFTLSKSKAPPVRAWLIPNAVLVNPFLNGNWTGDPRDILTLLESATPLESTQATPESWSIDMDATFGNHVIISQLADPQWKAYYVNRDDNRRYDREIWPVFARSGEPGGWQSVLGPLPGRWTLHLEYVAADLDHGVAISVVAWITWLLTLIIGTIKTRVSRVADHSISPNV